MELDHRQHMQRAIEIGRRNAAAPFGAVLIDAADGREIAVGLNDAARDPTLHGEIDCIRNAAAVWDTRRRGDYVLYTTAEPCPMCMAACVWAGFKAVVYGTSIPHLQDTGWFQIDLRAKTIAAQSGWDTDRVIGGVLSETCNQMFDEARKLHT